jgi:hypothetical protein
MILMARTVVVTLVFCAHAVCGLYGAAAQADFGQRWMVAANDQSGGGENDRSASPSGQDEKKKEPTPEEKMQARFPQPTKVGHLIGLPVLDENDSTIGYVQQVVRTPKGKIQLIVPYAKRFGWMRDNVLVRWSRRPVAVPIEVVAILALQINALDMDREAFEKSPVWVTGPSQVLPADETIKIALGRR